MITAMPRIAIAVEDFDAIVATFRDTFGMPVIDISSDSVDSLGAKLAFCVPPGGSNIELMSPARPEAPLSQSLQRFLDKRGDGLFALMMEAPVPNEEAEELLANGLGVLPLMEGAGGRDIHPKSTHGVLIRVYPNDSFQPTSQALTDAKPPTEDELQLSGIMKVMIAVSDLDKAMSVYGKGMGITIDAPTDDPDRGVKSALVHPPKGGVIELVTPIDTDKTQAANIAAFLSEKGEGMYALVLQSENVETAAEVLKGRDVHIDLVDDAVEIDRSDAHGALIRIEQN